MDAARYPGKTPPENLCNPEGLRNAQDSQNPFLSSIFRNSFHRKNHFRSKRSVVNSIYSEFRMNNIQFTSRRTDFKILKVVAVLGISALAGFVLALLCEGIYPEPFVPIGFAVFFWEAIVSVPLALFVWCSFLLVGP